MSTESAVSFAESAPSGAARLLSNIEDQSSVEPKLEPPLVIIGAARSGTNMLRDLLSSLEPFATWPCDEINYIWRHGNREFETEEFTPETVSYTHLTLPTIYSV